MTPTPKKTPRRKPEWVQCPKCKHVIILAAKR